MARTYQAILNGDHIEWQGESPHTDRPTKIEVVVHDEERSESDGHAMAEALRKIAIRGGVKSIPDPVAWQREIRKDRPLPGRE